MIIPPNIPANMPMKTWTGPDAMLHAAFSDSDAELSGVIAIVLNIAYPVIASISSNDAAIKMTLGIP